MTARQQLFDNVRVAALADVVTGTDPEYLLRGIFRWYSKEYYTPLHVVEELPLVDVLQHYYESKFDALLNEGKYPDLENERQQMVLTEEQLAAAKAEVDRELADTAEYATRVAKQAQKAVEEVAAVLPADIPKELPPDVHMVFGDDLDQDSLGVFKDEGQSSKEE